LAACREDNHDTWLEEKSVQELHEAHGDCDHVRSYCMDKAKKTAAQNGRLLDLDPTAVTLLTSYFDRREGRKLLGAGKRGLEKEKDVKAQGNGGTDNADKSKYDIKGAIANLKKDLEDEQKSEGDTETKAHKVNADIEQTKEATEQLHADEQAKLDTQHMDDMSQLNALIHHQHDIEHKQQAKATSVGEHAPAPPAPRGRDSRLARHAPAAERASTLVAQGAEHEHEGPPYGALDEQGMRTRSSPRTWHPVAAQHGPVVMEYQLEPRLGQGDHFVETEDEDQDKASAQKAWLLHSLNSVPLEELQRAWHYADQTAERVRSSLTTFNQEMEKMVKDAKQCLREAAPSCE